MTRHWKHREWLRTGLRVHRSSANSPDSGRPPAETAPGGRPDTTAPVEPADAHRLSAGRARPRLGPRRGSPDADQIVINPPVQLPVISADAAARALQERFLVNADRGDNAANDELVADLVHRIRTQRACPEGGC